MPRKNIKKNYRRRRNYKNNIVPGATKSNAYTFWKAPENNPGAVVVKHQIFNIATITIGAFQQSTVGTLGRFNSGEDITGGKQFVNIPENYRRYVVLGGDLTFQVQMRNLGFGSTYQPIYFAIALDNGNQFTTVDQLIAAPKSVSMFLPRDNNQASPFSKGRIIYNMSKLLGYNVELDDNQWGIANPNITRPTRDNLLVKAGATQANLSGDYDSVFEVLLEWTFFVKYFDKY